jgi:asparagine synthase (glutamine-hydrolysing)
MCGIAGLWSAVATPTPLNVLARRMADRLVHRGPDDAGEWSDEDRGIALAQRRLSIVDLSPAGHQPMHSASGRYVIVFNGEIYNHRELRAQLDAGAPREWRGHSDTEVLLAAIDAWGLDAALVATVGMFAFALWDRQDRRLTLARDRLGEKPLYYGRVGAGLAFASELKAIRALTPTAPAVDEDAVVLFLRHGYVPAPYCIYRGFRKIEPGCYETFQAPDRLPTATRYWSALEAARRGLATPLPGSEDELTERLDQLLRASVRGQMVADVPVGAFLSGGIDSSTVTALMQAESARPVRTFSIGFHEDQYNEAHHAAEVARHLHTDHTELYVTAQQALDVIPRLPAMYDEPFSDSSQIPTHLVCAMARRHVTVALSGDGGDELFGGYNRYLVGEAAWRRLRRVPPSVGALVAAAIDRVGETRWNRLGDALRPLAPARIPSNVGGKAAKLAAVLRAPHIEDVYERLISQWPEPARIALRGHEHSVVRAAMASIAAAPVEQMMYADLVTYLPDDILVKVDRAAMATSLETRVPLLDHRIVEFAWQVPLSMKVRRGIGKRLLRNVLRRYVPDRLIERPKMGFGVPIDVWLRCPLRDWAEDLLSERALSASGLLDVQRVRVAWHEHRDGRRAWQYPLWAVLMLQDWLRADARR